jgi:hypothetical protein
MGRRMRNFLGGNAALALGGVGLRGEGNLAEEEEWREDEACIEQTNGQYQCLKP